MPKESPADVQLKDLAALVAILQKLGGDCLHLKPGAPPRVRVGAELRPLPMPPVTAAQTEELVARLLTERQRSRLEAEQSLEVSLSSERIGRVRLRLFRQRGSVEMQVRPVREVVPTLAGVGLPMELKALQGLRGGIVLIAGATGSGKSTTLAALVQHLNRNRPCHILCIEEPIEFVHRPALSLVDQVEVGRDAPSQAAALRAAARQDVDVVAVEGLWGAEAVELVLHLSETGHLVLTSVGARSAGAAVDWLVERVEPAQRAVVRTRLARQLEMVLLQALVPRLDAAGRVLVSELTLRSRQLAQLVEEPDPLRRPAAGSSTMDAQLIALARKSVISWDEAALHALDTDAIERAIIFD